MGSRWRIIRIPGRGEAPALVPPVEAVFGPSAGRPPGLMPYADADALHRAHCPMCAEEDGTEPLDAAHFVDQLMARYAPPRLKALLTGGVRRPVDATRDDDAG